ncbi:MAG: hypothetical protein IJZ85_06155 [Lachnospiraceae bacterium]|nr:hypothetical protein [Lachnospiraceae bacterium]
MKKLLAMLLALVMVLSLAACGEKTTSTDVPTDAPKQTEADKATDAPQETEAPTEADPYEEHIDFTMTNFYSVSQAAKGHDLDADPVIQWVEDKFNVTIDAWMCATDTSQTVRLWCNSGTMPDVMVWYDLKLNELYDYADQGLIQGLPEDWETRWPNLAKMVAVSGYADMVKVDGITYAIPHAALGNNLQLDVSVAHGSLHFRKDWAKQVGMEDFGADGSVSLSELKEYLDKTEAAGLSNGQLGANASLASNAFLIASGLGTEKFVKGDNGFEYLPASEEYANVVKMLQEWAQGGYMDPDFYTLEKKDIKTAYYNGNYAAMYMDGGIGNYQDVFDNVLTINGFEKNNMEEREKLYDVYGIAAWASEDGVTQSQQNYNYWTMHTFAPECDEATMIRILDMIDYFCTKEGQTLERAGIPGQDWEFDAEGKVIYLNEDIVSGEYQVSPSRMFNVWGYCGDDLAYVPGIIGRYEAEQEMIKSIYAVRMEGNIIPVYDEVKMLNTESMANYSVDLDSKVAEIMTSNVDAVAEWNKFIEDNKALWQPVVDDLNK